MSPVTIPEPTAGLTSALVPFFILKPCVQTDATDIAGCYRMLRPFAHPVACCCVLLRKVWIPRSNFKLREKGRHNCQHCWANNVGSCCLRLYVALYDTVLLADVKRIVVIITDGFSSLGFEETKELTDQLKQSRIQFFSVGTSKRVNKPELDEISSQPLDTHELVVDLKNRSYTKAQVERLAKDICKWY